MSKQESDLLKIGDLAKYLRLDHQTISRKAQRGEIPGIKIGNRWRFKQEEIEQWLSSRPSVRREGKPLRDKLRAYARRDPRILLGYLFGSAARGQTRSDSDTDIAFLLKGEPIFDDKIALTSDLSGLLATDRVDVVLLNDAPPLLRHEVITDGQLFFCREEEVLNKFETTAFREYSDTEYLRRVQNAYLMDSILGGRE